jgi:hypothetical protein
MFIAATFLAWHKLRQERHGVSLCKHLGRLALNQNHAAPDGAWKVFWGSFSIDMALLTELCLTTIGRNQGLLGQSAHQVYDAAEKQSRMLSGLRKSIGVA